MQLKIYSLTTQSISVMNRPNPTRQGRCLTANISNNWKDTSFTISHIADTGSEIVLSNLEQKVFNSMETITFLGKMVLCLFLSYNSCITWEQFYIFKNFMFHQKEQKLFIYGFISPKSISNHITYGLYLRTLGFS